MFFASLLPQFVPAGRASLATFLAFGLVFCALGLAWLSLYAAAVDRLRTFVVGRARRWLDAVTGFVLIALGLRLASEDA